MKQGSICFLKENFFEQFSSQNLMKNKILENSDRHKRPYLIALVDKKNPNIFWAVPISSKHEKYQEKYQRSIEKYHRCDTIRFGYLFGYKKAFLLQNMCPVTQNYIDQLYCDHNGNPAHINNSLLQKITYAAEKILKKNSAGIHLTYANIDEMYQELENELFEARIIEPKKISVEKKENAVQAFCEKWARQQSAQESDDMDIDDTEDYDVNF